MANYDQAQSARLGQPIPPSNTTVLFYTGEDLPEVAWHGHMVYREDQQILQVYDGAAEAWEDVTTGGFGILTFVGAAPPISVNIGDLWFHTGDNRKMYRAASVGADEISATEWVLVRDQGIESAAIQANTAYDLAADAMGVATSAEAIADGKITTYYESTMPPSPPASLGDLWFNETTKHAYMHDGTTFISVQDEEITEALEAASDAQSTADGKVEAFFQNSEPSHAISAVGDLWYDTNDSMKAYFFSSVTNDYEPLPLHGDGVIDSGWEGKTITGATIRTAPTGSRVEMRDDDDSGIVEFYSGATDETPGSLDAFFGTVLGTPYTGLNLSSGYTVGSGGAPRIAMQSRGLPGGGGPGGIGGLMDLMAGSINVTASADGFAGDLHLYGGATTITGVEGLVEINNGSGSGETWMYGDVFLTTSIHNVYGGDLLYYEQEWATTDLTLNNSSFQNVPGASIAVPVANDQEVYEVIGVFDFHATTGGTGSAMGGMKAETTGGGFVTPTGVAVFSSDATGGRATVVQTWRISGVVAGTRDFILTAQRTAAGTGTYEVKGHATTSHTSISVKRIS